MRRSPLAILIVTGPFVALAVGLLLTRGGALRFDIPASGPVTIALAGDVLMSRPLGSAERDEGFVAIRDLLRGAHFAAANLDMNLLSGEEAVKAQARPSPRWPFGTDREAAALGSLGFDAFSLANDHSNDYGVDGLRSTIRILDRASLLHAGTGDELHTARAPVFVGRAASTAPQTAAGLDSTNRRLAFISVAASSMPDARATAPRADIAGRPGLSPLRYAADITVDAATFQTLKDSLAALSAGPPAGPGELTMFGTPIRKGERTIVEFTVDESDERDVLDVIRAAREVAETVVVSLHSHEPANASDQPAAFVTRFARSAIDAGATLVVGHGPHRLRGVERYKDGAILYSLGNFLYQQADLDFRAANLFDQGADLYQAAIGGLGERQKDRQTPPDTSEWWEGLLAVATVERGRVGSIMLYPLDLGVENALADRGIPRLARGADAERILSRLRDVSTPSQNELKIEQGGAVLRGTSPNEIRR